MILKDKVALVTGSAQGIGKAIAQSLAAEGARVVIADVNFELAKQTSESLAGSIAVALNVSDPNSIKSAVEIVSQKFGRIDILVNNAGITRDTLLLRMKEEDWNLVISVNLSGAYLCIKQVLPLMIKARSGKIVNIASIVGLMGNAGQANYSASKAGLIGLTKTVAREVASRNVNVNAVAPGFIDTEMTKKLSEDVKKKMYGQIPLGRFGRPEDVAEAVIFLCSEKAAYITGQVLSVNGGMLMP